MTLHDDTTAKDALIAHLERELKEARMTLRDNFAAQSISGINPGRLFGDDGIQIIAEMAYKLADAMMEARKK